MENHGEKTTHASGNVGINIMKVKEKNKED
jgi:hypothetical protein